jgi:ribA/ribD-fused uncharacterized protein
LIDSFRGKHAFLSNFHMCWVTYDGVRYPSVEHAYQAQKAPEADRGAFTTGTPGQAKRLGRKYKVEGWHSRSLGLMEELLRIKFTGELAGMLKATGDEELVEGNTWNDRFWGKCRGVGENHLGRLLMKIRDEV